ncbi:MAG: peptidoglycan-binding protein [Archangium sp.]|nr:peptidoglycan-binding protein [Archangium sp.]
MTINSLINKTPFPRLPRPTKPRPELPKPPQKLPGRPISISTPGSEGAKQLSRGASGPEVEKLQKQLKALGYEVEVDGKFGPETEAAVRQYQEDRGLKADGIVGPLTHMALDKDMLKRIVAPRHEIDGSFVDKFLDHKKNNSAF